jgi:hypothetical protein
VLPLQIQRSVHLLPLLEGLEAVEVITLAAVATVVALDYQADQAVVVVWPAVVTQVEVPVPAHKDKVVTVQQAEDTILTLVAVAAQAAPDLQV